MVNPTPQEVKQRRELYGLTQTQASALVYRTLRNWQQWELGERKIDLAAWELFNLKMNAAQNLSTENVDNFVCNPPKKG